MQSDILKGWLTKLHVLANLALSQLLDFVWRGECPIPIQHIVLAEQVL
jgi:hypothetical protein